MANLIFPTGFEEKETIAQDDMILMADSEDSNKIKKAKYSNLKGEKGDPGQNGQDGTDGTDGASIVSAAFSGNDIVFTKDNSQTVTLADAKTTLQGPQGEDGPEGHEGPAGNGIASITSSKSGKITTVTITETNGDSESFTVSDGADGQGAGDVVGPNSSTDGNVVAFDGITGKLIKDGSVSLATLSAGASAGATAVQPGDLGTAASKNTGTSSGNVPVLDSNGKLATSTLPGVALTDTFTVSTSADLTTLSSADQGDIAIVTSENKTYVLSVAPYSTAANWKEILAPTGGVTSVNGQTGAVTVPTGDISYIDFETASVAGATVTLSYMTTQTTPTSNFTVTCGTVKEGMQYILRVNSGATAYTMTLGTGITNPFGEDLTLTASKMTTVVLFAASSSALEVFSVRTAS